MCGPIDVNPTDITVSTRPGAIDAVYRFKCSECSETITRRASPSDVASLLRAGAHVDRLQPSPTADDDVIVLTDERLELPISDPEVRGS
jgi:hypothetical protein